MKEALICAMDIGEQMLVCGAEIRRVEDSMERMCYALGAKRIDVFIITSSMVVTVHDANGNAFTQTRRVLNIGTDIEKLHRLNELSREICRGNLSVEEIRAKYDAVMQSLPYPFWAECIAYAVIAGAFTLFFGGNRIESIVSLIVGAVVRFVVLLADKSAMNKIFAKFLCCFAATAMAFIAVRLGIIETVDMIVIGNIMTLIPGIGLTNALRDLFTGDSISGLLRSIEAVLIALAISAGYFLCAFIAGGVAV